MNIRFLICLFTLLLAFPLAAHADSLFAPDDEGDPHKVGLYGKHPVVLEIGDIVKVNVREKTTADVELGLETKDESKSGIKMERSGNLLGRVLDPFLDLIGEGELGFESEGDFKDDGKTDRTVRLDGIVTALVVDVLDNGYAIIEGRKRVNVNNEEQTMVVRGLIDPKDLDSERMIDSDMVADVEIEYIGEGQLSKKSKPGFLSRIFDAIF